MHRAVAKCLKINLGYKSYQIPSFLISGSDVTLIWQSYFDENLMHLVRTHSDEKSEAHTLFHLMVANDEQLPIMKYVELDLNFMGLIFPRAGILVTTDPNQLLDPKHHTRLPGVVGWNLVHLAFKEFITLYGTAVFNSFDCKSGVNPLLFLNFVRIIIQMFAPSRHQAYTLTSETPMGWIDPLIKNQNFSGNKED